MATRSAAQVLTTSTMGTDQSIPLNRAVERGRLAVELGERSGVAYFEWSADPADEPDDPATWRRCMPALGYTITEAVVAHARSTLTAGEFSRAFLNLRTKADDRVLPAAKWAAVCDDTASPAAQPVFALDVNPERSAGAIVAASTGIAELVEYQGGTGWLVPRAVELAERWGTPRWIVDSTGPAASLIPEMERAGLKVEPASARDLVAACGQFYDAVIENRIRIRRHVRLDEAAAGAAKRSIGDAWAWTRKSAAADISPLVAATLALWGAEEGPEDELTPFFFYA